MARALFIAGIILASALGLARAQEQRTIRGEIVGAACYTDTGKLASSSDAQTSCSLSALKAGEPAGVVDQKTGKLYIAVSGDGTNIADKLLPNVAKLVDVTGTVQQKAGVNTITVSEVKPVGNLSSEAGMGNATVNSTGLPSGTLGSGDEPVPQVPWAGSGAVPRNDTLFNVTRAPGIHAASPREIPGIPNRGTRTGEVYMNEGEQNTTE